MADYTVTTDMTLEQAITNGSMTDGENLTINNGSVVTCTQTPSILMGEININDGKLFVDGLNISSGNVINFVGEEQQALNVNYSGALEVTGDWYDIGTTDGSDSQTFSLSSYWGGSLEDAVPGIWIETGRRIDFDNSSGTLPEVDDWVHKVSDKEVFGRIIEVNASGSFIVVQFLTGSLANNDELAVKKIVDNSGPDFQITWTADVNNASGDIKEDGIYQEFGNTRENGTNYLSYMGHGVGGFCFDQQFQSNTITMGTSTGTNGGFVPPSGCNVRIPNIHFSNSTTTDYSSGNTNHAGAFIYNWFELTTTKGGRVDLSICNIGTASFACLGAVSFLAEYTGSTVPLGSKDTFANVEFHHCIIAKDPVDTAIDSTSDFMLSNIIGSAKVYDCLIVKPRNTSTKIETSNTDNVEFKNIIATYGGASPNFEDIIFNFIYSANVEMNNCVVVSSSNSETKMVNIDSSTDITINYIKCSTTQDYTSSVNSFFVYFTTGSSGCKVVGIDVIGDGYSTQNMFSLYNVSDIKIRCLGMIDDKLDLSGNGQAVFNIISYASNVDIARIWTDNAETYGGYPYMILWPLLILNDVKITNCSGDYSSTIQQIGVDGLLYKGLHGGAQQPGWWGGIQYELEGCYGYQIHDNFRSDTLGSIYSLLVGPSQSINNVTIISGNPSFLNNGTLTMSSGDQLVIEQSYFANGHTAFNGDFSALTGWQSWGDDNWSNVTVDFQYDLGTGYNGTWLNARTSTNLTSITGTHQFNYDNESSGPFTVGETLSWGTGGTAGTGVLSKITDNGNTGVIDIILMTGIVPTDGLEVTGGTSSATCDLNGSVDKNSLIVDGVKIKLRFTATGSQSSMTLFALDTTTTLTDQVENQYPIDQSYVSLKVTTRNAATNSLIENARVYLVADAGGPLTEGTEILNTLTNASGYVEDTVFLYSSDQPIRGWARKSSPGDDLYKNQLISGTIGSNGFEIVAFLIPDS